MAYRKMLAMLLLSGLLSACGAGGDENDTATCEEAGKAHAYCLNRIDGENLRGDYYVTLFTKSCEAVATKDCILCQFENPCIPSEEITPLSTCVEVGRCPEIEIEE